MIVPLLLSAILLIHDFPSVYTASTVQLAEGKRCLTPNEDTGICRKVASCTVIVKALNTQSSQAVRFAQQSQCGYSTSPLVCCGSSGFFTTKEVYQHRLLPTSNKCGIEHTNDQIIHHGEEADLREFPWTALLGFVYEGKSEPKFECGGSLINNRYVLTAAHCVKSKSRTLVKVRLGEHDRATNIDCAGKGRYEICNPPAEDFAVETVVSHPSYTHREKANDIALVRLNRDVEFKEHIQPICLPVPAESTSQMVVTSVTVAGWGETEKGTSSSVKLKAKLKITPLFECADRFRSQTNITDKQYCAAGFCKEDGTKCADSCQGDSGGPSIRSIQLPTDIQWIQEGITSTGNNICGQGYPAIYTRVSKYVQWIGDNLKD